MPTGTFSKVFNTLVADGKIAVKTGSAKEHELLRVRLCKHFTRHKDVMVALGAESGEETLSVCATFTEETGESTFQIARRKSQFGIETKTFEIITISTSATTGEEQEKAA